MFHPASTNLSRPRQKAQVSSKLDKNLAAYMLAAGAAGVGILGSALPAQAKVVYTPADQPIKAGYGLNLDLTGHGITDFVFSNYYSSTSSILNLSVGPANSKNAIFSVGTHDRSYFAANLPAGIEVGPEGRFKKGFFEEMANGFGTQPICRGPWVHANERYLGLEFVLDGETHFGWARLSVNCDYPHPVRAVLTGYAYETVADQPIVTGDTKEANASDAGSLGNLALGAAAQRPEQASDKIH